MSTGAVSGVAAQDYYQRFLARHSFIEMRARERARTILDPGSFRELLGPFDRIKSPWLPLQGIVAQADDGVVLARGTLDGEPALVLADDIGQRARPQFVRQRMRRVLLHPRRGEQGGRFAWALRAHPPSVTLICWPPRTTVMRQSRADSRVAFSRSLVLAIF